MENVVFFDTNIFYFLFLYLVKKTNGEENSNDFKKGEEIYKYLMKIKDDKVTKFYFSRIVWFEFLSGIYQSKIDIKDYRTFYNNCKFIIEQIFKLIKDVGFVDSVEEKKYDEIFDEAFSIIQKKINPNLFKELRNSRKDPNFKKFLDGIDGLIVSEFLWFLGKNKNGGKHIFISDDRGVCIFLSGFKNENILIYNPLNIKLYD